MSEIEVVPYEGWWVIKRGHKYYNPANGLWSVMPVKLSSEQSCIEIVNNLVNK
jgi:hypothetical protein